ncbi:phage terminase small subunit [Enterococcus lactis]|uniref:phage terminase small subunit n=1 Tax=Enterococcus TaxID=1350 RepID=UPI00064CD730|nr:MULTISPECIES: phage terminase small subunit [Enterococcus]MCM6896566.1 phage terminase small subunit [Enterococcus faecium]MCM6907679.1 phage terminase small subunit [Enterococcus faecium]MCM6926303.1 phage terminase small subunit [Enterococcus faecium]MCM6935880.1 phage terminase small subunit [Enterococcus faecium]MEB5582507.1 phage terminase small subunit [Enterococcus faecium]
MARQRDPRRNEAKKIWLESDGKKQLKEVASELNVSDSQVRKWKSQDKWSAELKSNVTNGKSNVTNQGGAPLGNQNAKGNKGNSRASPPVGNKNALKTGEYETIFFETLSDEEKDIYSSLNDDPSFALSEEIRLLKIRQLRMMKRIQQAEAGLNDEEVERLQQLRNIKTPLDVGGKKLEIKREVMQDVQITRKTRRKIDDILSIEDSLTRISNQLSRAIKQLSELSVQGKRAALMTAQAEKLNAEIRELNGGEDEPESTVIIDDIPLVESEVGSNGIDGQETNSN